MGKKNLRRISLLVTAQTAHNLERLADMEGSRNVGKVVDKLTREKMLSLHVEKRERENEDKRGAVIRYRPERYEKFEEIGLNDNGEPLYVKRVRVDEKSYAMYCPDCGKRLCSRFTRYCPNCGAGMK